MSNGIFYLELRKNILWELEANIPMMNWSFLTFQGSLAPIRLIVSLHIFYYLKIMIKF